MCRFPGGRLFRTAAVCITAALVFLQSLWLDGAFLPRWVLWQEREGVLEEPSRQGQFHYELRGRYFFLYRDEERIYEAPGDWRIQDVLTDDVNGDGKQEIVMLAWRRGNYGDHMPSWVEKNDTSFSQHLFVYTLRDEDEDGPALRALWMSSALGFEVRTMESGGEVRGTGRPSLTLTGPDGSVSHWAWLSWGYRMVEEISVRQK